MFVNTFPDILTYALLAPTLLRITAASFFAYLATYHFKHKKAAAVEFSIVTHNTATVALGLYAFVEAAVALMLLLGSYTQLAALLGAALCAKIIFIRRDLRHIAPLSRGIYVLLCIVCLSLLLTGAGLHALDLPL